MEGFYKRQIPFISTFVDLKRDLSRLTEPECQRFCHWNTSKISHSHYGNAQIQAAISWSTWNLELSKLLRHQRFTSGRHLDP